MPELAPMATYMTLAPFVGAEEAYERAVEESENGEGGGVALSSGEVARLTPTGE
jgi:hypothetical protein